MVRVALHQSGGCPWERYEKGGGEGAARGAAIGGRAGSPGQNVSRGPPHAVPSAPEAGRNRKAGATPKEEKSHLVPLAGGWKVNGGKVPAVWTLGGFRFLRTLPLDFNGSSPCRSDRNPRATSRPRTEAEAPS